MCDPAKVVPYLVTSAMISKGPFMIYYAQELGERGADNEGFAGNNCRTTIFDYWSMATMRRWYNAGAPGLRRLSQHERWLRGVYSRVLNLCNSSSAVREGGFFDLMYVNLRNPHFNPHRQFAFLRYSDREALLFLVNFSAEDAEVDVVIPDLAFNMASLEEGEVVTDDLLWGAEHRFTMKRDGATSLKIKGYGALILPIPKIASKS